MRIQDIQIGESYRLRQNPLYGWVKAEEKLKPKQGVNTHTYSIVKCMHTVNKDDNIGFIRNYRPCDMVSPKVTLRSSNKYLSVLGETHRKGK